MHNEDAARYFGADEAVWVLACVENVVAAQCWFAFGVWHFDCFANVLSVIDCFSSVKIPSVWKSFLIVLHVFPP
jgi:hypothetical protein